MLLLNSATGERQPANGSIPRSGNAADAEHDPFEPSAAADDGADRSEPPDAPAVHEPDQPAEPRPFAGNLYIV